MNTYLNASAVLPAKGGGPLVDVMDGRRSLCRSTPENICTLYSIDHAWNGANDLVDVSPQLDSDDVTDYYSHRDENCIVEQQCPLEWQGRFEVYTNTLAGGDAISTSEPTTVGNVDQCALGCLSSGAGRCAAFNFNRDSLRCQYFVNAASNGAVSSSQDLYILSVDDTTCLDTPPMSQAWLNFKESRTNTSAQSELPDYSYTGYKRGEEAVPIATGDAFLVEDFGAIADDSISDHQAIQDTILAAEANGGGRVVFGSGTYLIRDPIDMAANRSSLVVHHSNIVLQGVGSRQGGTVIHIVEPYLNTTHKWGTKHAVVFEPDPEVKTIVATVAVVGEAERGSFWITVEVNHEIVVGDVVDLYIKSDAMDIKSRFLAPHTIFELVPNNVLNRKNWGIQIHELHEIAEVDGSRIRMLEPLHVQVLPTDGYVLRRHVGFLRNVGVEDISFLGGLLQYKHHRNNLEDCGWAGVMYSKVVDGYMRRLSFVNVSKMTKCRQCKSVSLYQITAAGTGAHTPMENSKSYGVFIGLFEDITQGGYRHSPSTSNHIVSTVIWRSDFEDAPFDAHGSQPYVTLFDRVHGGNLAQSGGSRHNNPNMLYGLTFWNYKHKALTIIRRNPDPLINPLFRLRQFQSGIVGKDEYHYDFWPRRPDYGQHVFPNVIGFHGDPASFERKQAGIIESNGAQVGPESLFEAQLALRLGGLPSFYNEIRVQWNNLRRRPVVTH